MCDEKVINLLKNRVKKSIGTATFLELLRDIVDSYLDKKLTPLMRVRKAWYSLFVIRLWREYVKSSPTFTLGNNFMSSNCFNCIELNAHSLVLILLYLEEKNMPQLFTPHLFNSQSLRRDFSPNPLFHNGVLNSSKL